MTHPESATRLVTLRDWAHAGNARTLVLVRPDGDDSLVKRLKEGRLSEADRQYLDRIKEPERPLATIGDLRSLWKLMQTRYGVLPASPASRETLAPKVVEELAAVTHSPFSQIWNMTLGDVVIALESIPRRAAHRKRRGRKRADDETICLENQLVDVWNRARESGVCKTSFADDNDTTTEELDRLLDRVAKRKSRSEQ